MSQAMKIINSLLVAALGLASVPPTVVADEQAQAAEMPGVSESATKTERLTLELQGVTIFDVFKILSKKSGLNIVAGKNVQGQVSIYLQDVPVRDALKTILQSQGLASVEEDGIIKVMTEEEYLKKYGRPYEDARITKAFDLRFASAETLAGKLAEIKSSHGKIITEVRTNTLIITDLPKVLEETEKLIRESDQPQESEIFHLDYTKVEDLEPKLKAMMEGTGGKLEIDKRSNRVIVFDISSRIQRIGALVKAFDVKTQQVLIDARIVEVRLSDAYRKGINWQEIIEQVGDFDTLKALAPLAVSPPTGAASLATLALGSGQDDLQVVLDLLERVGKTNLLSSPRIMVVNNEEAKLAVATREPFVSQTVVQTVNSTNTADNVQFVDVGVTLKVLPRISHDNHVELKIKPEVSSSSRSLELQGVAQGSNTTFTRTRIPIVTTQELMTTVLVKSGTTLVIGGLIQDQQAKVSSRVPILSSIPLFGRLFESNTDDFTKTELVIFITPQINPGATTEQDQFLTNEGKMKSFDEFAGSPLRMPNGVLASKKAPFWEKETRDKNHGRK